VVNIVVNLHCLMMSKMFCKVFTTSVNQKFKTEAGWIFS